MRQRWSSNFRVSLALSVFLMLGMKELYSQTEEGTITLQTQQMQVQIQPEGTCYAILDASRKKIADFHPVAGILFSAPGEEILQPASIEKIVTQSDSVCIMLLANEAGATMTASFILTASCLNINMEGDASHDYIMDIRTAPLSPAYGLGDHGGYYHQSNLFGYRNEQLINTGNAYRFVSSFAIFPKQGLGQLVLENGMKRIAIDHAENKMGVAKTHQLSAYYFIGTPPEIYQTYRQVRTKEGYRDFQPKFTFFELGYEAFGSLGWNTYQTSVEQDIEAYLERGYALKWAVVGSGFWKGERGNPEEGATTSFGIWDSVQAADREDNLPNPRYPQVADFKGFFKKRDIKLLLGLRINFKSPQEEGGYYHPDNDGQYTLEGLKKNYFIKTSAGKADTFKVHFPKGNVYLLDGQNHKAVEWYVDGVKKWGADGYKEDLMFFEGIRLNNDAKLNPVNEALMQEGYYVMARNAAFSVAGDILRLEDTKHGFNQDRPVLNSLSYAASGYSWVYPDIVAGKYLKMPLTEDQKQYFVRNAMFAAVTPVMSFGLGPWHLRDQQMEADVKKAADLHRSLAPYIYSEVVRNYQTGFPHAMTPLPIAFPKDSMTYHLADTLNRQYAWMIGKSLLAAPLYGEDYATATSRDIYLPEGKWMDWDSGKILEGGRTYEDYAFPPSKLPLFVGGDDVIVLRKNAQLYAYFFPLNKKVCQYTFTFPDGKSTTRITTTSVQGKKYYVAKANGEKSELIYDKGRSAYYFKLEPEENYSITAE